MPDKLNLIEIIGALNVELGEEHEERIKEKRTGDEWHKQLCEKRRVVAEKNDEINKLMSVLATKNTIINLSTKENKELKEENAGLENQIGLFEAVHAKTISGINEQHEQIAKLKKEYGELSNASRIIRETSQTIRAAYLKEKAKASKANAAKMKLLRMLKRKYRDAAGQAFRKHAIDEYNKYVKDCAKKVKKNGQ